MHIVFKVLNFKIVMSYFNNSLYFWAANQKFNLYLDVIKFYNKQNKKKKKAMEFAQQKQKEFFIKMNHFPNLILVHSFKLFFISSR